VDGTPVTDPDPVSDPVITPVTDPVVDGGSTDQAGQPATPTVTGETSDGTVTGSWEVTGTSESADALPSTGSNATGIGMAGLILVGLGLALRRATKG
jgi:LPXTG-motif cell wall-anchored protein